MLLLCYHLHGAATTELSQSQPEQTNLELSQQGNREHLKFDDLRSLQEWLSHRGSQRTTAQHFVFTIERALNYRELETLNNLLKPFESVEIKLNFEAKQLSLIYEMIAAQKIKSLNLAWLKIEEVKTFWNFLKEEVNKGNNSLKSLTLSILRLDDKKLIEFNALLNEFSPETVLLDIKGGGGSFVSGGEFKAEGLALINEMIVDQKIKSLDLYNNNIRDEEAKALFYALRNNKTVKKLNLMFTLIGDEGVIALADALKKNTTITELYLANRENYNKQIEELGLKALADALRVNKTLKKLFIRDIKKGGEGFKTLANVLKDPTTTLEDLEVLYSTINEEDAQALAEALRVNTTLKELHLSACLVRDAGAKYLVEALKDNTVIKKLDLQNNPIGKEGKATLERAQEEAEAAGRNLIIFY